MAIDWQKWKVSYLHMVFQWKPPFIDIGYFPAMFDDTRGHIPLNPHQIPIKDTTVDRLKLPDGNQKNYIQVLSRMSFPSLSPFILLISPLCHHSPHDLLTSSEACSTPSLKCCDSLRWRTRTSHPNGCRKIMGYAWDNGICASKKIDGKIRNINLMTLK